MHFKETALVLYIFYTLFTLLLLQRQLSQCGLSFYSHANRIFMSLKTELLEKIFRKVHFCFVLGGSFGLSLVFDVIVCVRHLSMWLYLSKQQHIDGRRNGFWLPNTSSRLQVTAPLLALSCAWHHTAACIHGCMWTRLFLKYCWFSFGGQKKMHF